jgi:(1->4)-alpha-D-glucan 1-alpha-D-glucosylmutase
MLYQTLLGAWPLEGPGDDFVKRVQEYAIKAAREGKEQSAWLAPNEDYENGLKDFIARILDCVRSGEFLESFNTIARRAALLGALNSLTQLTLKATMPGVPDFYQGTEFWDLSLVDPDNRRPVDFKTRHAALDDIGDTPDWDSLARDWQSGRIKLALTRRLLAIRNRFGAAFTNGDYRPLEVTGPHRDEIVAFARTHGRETVIVVAGRLFGRATDRGRTWPSSDAWAETFLVLDSPSSMRAMLGSPFQADTARLPISKLFSALPLAILQAEAAKLRKPRMSPASAPA